MMRCFRSGQSMWSELTVCAEYSLSISLQCKIPGILAGVTASGRGACHLLRGGQPRPFALHGGSGLLLQLLDDLDRFVPFFEISPDRAFEVERLVISEPELAP